MKVCRNCIYAIILNVDRKGDLYRCPRYGYDFMGYWSRTKAETCPQFKSELDKSNQIK